MIRRTLISTPSAKATVFLVVQSFLAVAFGSLLVVMPRGVVGEGYEIGSGDVLHVAVFGQQEMTGDFTVDSKGLLNFPFLGRVKASGLSPEEVERKLTTLLASGFLKNPHVSVEIKDYRSRKVFVTGEIQKPGAYGLRPERSLLLLLGDIGELSSTT